MSYIRARISTMGLNALCLVTSETRSPSIQISRPSRSPARYSSPVRIILVPHHFLRGSLRWAGRLIKYFKYWIGIEKADECLPEGPALRRGDRRQRQSDGGRT